MGQFKRKQVCHDRLTGYQDCTYKMQVLGGEIGTWPCSFGGVSAPSILSLVDSLLTGHTNRKIENFIRTKYESKRWVLQDEIPDPSTLDDGDDDVVSGRMMNYEAGSSH
jgi:hypothetical protein